MNTLLALPSAVNVRSLQLRLRGCAARVVGFAVSASVALVAGASMGAASATTPVPLIYTDPAWAPSGKKIAFVIQRQLGAQGTLGALYTMNADGSGVTRLTHEAEGTDWPAWSPDSKRVTFVKLAAASETTIYVVNGDGRHLREMEPGFYPEWSPGGRRIAYNDGILDASVGSIAVLDPDGSLNRVVATHDDGVAYEMPTWSPDGQRLAFVPTAPPDSGGLSGGACLVYIQQYNGNIKDLSRKGCGTEPDWSPDGRRIAYTVFLFAPTGPPVAEVRVVDLRSQRISRLHSGWHPRWSPDGRRIVFADGNRATGPSQIYVMNADGSGVHQLTR